MFLKKNAAKMEINLCDTFLQGAYYKFIPKWWPPTHLQCQVPVTPSQGPIRGLCGHCHLPECCKWVPGPLSSISHSKALASCPHCQQIALLLNDTRCSLLRSVPQPL